VTEDEIVGVPRFADLAAFPVLPGLVRRERGESAFREDERAPSLGVLVSPVLLAGRGLITTH
jgi:hypothetical protein